MHPKSRRDFAIAIICALPVEADAVEGLFDETYDRLGRSYGKQPGDTNAYINGRIGHHNVVLCYMPGMGKDSAASVASTLRISYTAIQVALIVGICGGVPSPSPGRQIYLGDVLISDSVVAYDFGRQYPAGFRRKTNVKDTLGRPNLEIRSLLAGLKASRSQTEFQHQIKERQDGSTQDASYLHKHHPQFSPSRCGCSADDSPYNICDGALEIECYDLGFDDNRVIRQRNDTTITKPSVHIGTIASADTVMKSGEHRDAITREERVLGFEMEAAAVWDNIPCIIIKGICDYADMHKTKAWQCYAAATGASARPFWDTGDLLAQVCLSLSSQANDESNQTPPIMVDEQSIRTVQGSEGKSTALQEHTSTKGISTTGLVNDTKLRQVETLGSLQTLGDALYCQAMYGEAERSYRVSWNGRRRILGGIHSDTLRSRNSLGDALYRQGKYALAETTYRDAWDGRKKTLGDDHPDTLMSLHWVGQALYSQEKYVQAQAPYRDAWEGQKRVLGEKHADTLASFHGLEDALRKSPFAPKKKAPTPKGITTTLRSVTKCFPYQCTYANLFHIPSVNTTFRELKLLLP
ncbi:uncharacterized protein N7482_000298 [Penicillium canariense]|uniref:Nucleoside phosphorylase domain-containing protein n=1 Tax=Penicillium canariense TaxID=189055 RepID=A0A9W9IF23_9EURO|nr:uncharacterized protein N7482_000298 [Penicillium canariense]KAJ5174421.1 hypothetical protein N7482_000298 [Penicillium canariense]